MKNIRMKFTICMILVISHFVLGMIGLIYSNVRNNVDNSFKLNGNNKVTVVYGETYNDEGYSIDLNDSNKANIKTANTVDTTKVGDYEVKYTLKYKNYNKSLIRKVKVVDKQSPIIQVDCENEVYVVLNNKFNGCKYTVSDNYDPKEKIKVDIISNIDTTKVGDYEVIWKATDKSKNTSEKKVIAHVKEKKDLFYVKVSISKQRLDYYENGKVYLSTPITSGKYDKTPKGNFKVVNKARKTILKSGNYVVKVDYWIGFQGHKYGIHDASWRTKFGGMDYYYNGSHGCVNTPDDAIKVLYDRIEVGTPVYIVD